MQETGSIPHWMQLALTGIASLLSGIGIDKLYNTWLNRQKPAAEVAEITVRSHSTAGDAVIRMMTRLDNAQATIDRLRAERDQWELKSFDLQLELRDSRTVNVQLMTQAKLDNHHMRKQMNFIDMKNLKQEFIDLDNPKDNDPCGEDQSSS